MTKLLYLEDFDVVESSAAVEKVEQFDGRDVVVLDQTCFYPKGGGQDYDQGMIATGSVKISVEEVYFVDGEVKHVGAFEAGQLAAGDKVSCKVDQARRSLNTKIHSAGHVIDMAVRGLGYTWIAGKGAHYPHMAFVEYSGEYDGEKKQDYIDQLQSRVDELIERGSTNHIEFMTPDEMTAKGATVPENMPKDKPSRVMVYDDFAVPCGGTHIKNIADIGQITITKLKKKDGNIRLSYQVQEA